MICRILIPAALCMTVLPGAALAAEMREGLWEIHVDAELGGQPVTQGPLVVRQCMNQEGVQDMMAKLGGEGACKISDLEQSGGHARWNLTCSGQTEISGTAEADFGADEFSGGDSFEMKYVECQ